MQNNPRKNSDPATSVSPGLPSASPGQAPSGAQASSHPPAAIYASDVDFNSQAAAPAASENAAVASQEATGARLRAHTASERILREAVKGEYLYGMLGLILGLAAILGGVVLGLNGVVGHTSWSANLLGLSSNVNDAGPGVVLFLVGLFMIRSTRPDVNLKKLKG